MKDSQKSPLITSITKTHLLFLPSKQYKRHDITDWIGEHQNGSELNGFKWRAGRRLETAGIWMWSEIFTHDAEDGEKIAIILLDTQGIFDSRSNVHEYTTIFSLSMMLSSVQCLSLIHI